MRRLAGRMQAPIPSLLLTTALMAGSAGGANVEVNPRKITVGDPVEVIISADIPAGAKLIWPGADEFAPAEVLKIDTLEATKDRQVVRYSVSLFQVGRADLPELALIYVKSDGADTVRVDPGAVVVESILNPADTLADIRDIHPPVRLAWTFRDLLPYLVGLVLVAGLAIAAYLWWKNRRQRLGLEPVWTPPPPDPYDLALRRMEDLRVKQLWQNGYMKEFHSELDEILKEYIGGRWQFGAPEMTTWELLNARSLWPAGDESFRVIRRILTCGDLVKFARFKPDPAENDSSLNGGFRVLELTKPAPAGLVVAAGESASQPAPQMREA